MKQYSEYELRCFALVDKYLEKCGEPSGGNRYQVEADRHSNEFYYTLELVMSHDLVIYRKGYPDRESIMSLSPKGIDVVRNGGFKAYIDRIEEHNQKKADESKKAAEKLENDLWLSTQSKKNYKQTRWFAIIGFVVSIASVLFQIIKALFFS